MVVWFGVVSLAWFHSPGWVGGTDWEGGMDKKVYGILVVMDELWAVDEGAMAALVFALENVDRSCWIAIGIDPIEGHVGEAPPVETWRLN